MNYWKEMRKTRTIIMLRYANKTLLLFLKPNNKNRNSKNIKDSGGPLIFKQSHGIPGWKGKHRQFWKLMIFLTIFSRF